MDDLHGFGDPAKGSLPYHQAVTTFDSGVLLKKIDPESPVEPIRYAHRDDYYLFGMVDRGSCRVALDFEEHRLSAGDVFCVRPGQMHRMVQSAAVKATVLFVDAAFVDRSDRRTFVELAFRPRPFRPDASLRADLSALFAMIDRWSGILSERPDAEEPRRMVQRLAGAVAAMVAVAVRMDPLMGHGSGRAVDLALAFRELLDRERLLPGGPARYAAELHVSPGYLNEAVRSVAGESVGSCIRNEQILRARRLLIHTSLDIREIAFELGFEDAAYFSRLFTKRTGTSPSAFRRQYLG